ncbi:uncharacterized protein C8Q71DRAFT_725513 [Rhodofomes roseus]|uniref:Uncharacterized protein n=1 Tax=Rhodofomes roseus TaxID=34475 RepID=A0ABQ8K8U8_9APHY|nr:uncharacterized protein C8Q71DRAFT_725513 [Rhodofomes roseus]KAH9833747.1 hypothetical protein C8Q71DRAFT_725513 [Rhodofomes roseus]
MTSALTIVHSSGLVQGRTIRVYDCIVFGHAHLDAFSESLRRMRLVGISRNALTVTVSHHGFNLILHGRNEAKLLKVKNEFQGSARTRNVKLIDLNITVVLHNVGSSQLTEEKINGLSKTELMNIINLNAIFPRMITHTLLSQLHLSSRTGPVLVQFMGSQAGELSPARLAV